MSIRLRLTVAAVGAFALGVVASGEAQAQANVLKECGSQYQAAKAANALNGQSWQEYLKDCRTRVTTPAAAPAPVPAPAPAPAAAPPPPPPPPAPAPVAAPAPAPAPTKPTMTMTPAPAAPAAEKPPAGGGGRAAETSRQKQCGAEWKAQKAEIRKTNPNAKWPQYWSECNKRLKAQGM